MANILDSYKEVKILHTMLEIPEKLVDAKNIPLYGGAYFFIVNFKQSEIAIRAFGGKEDLKTIIYDDIDYVYLYACSRNTAINFKKTMVYKFDIAIVLKDQSIYYMESQDYHLFQMLIDILEKNKVSIKDPLQLNHQNILEYITLNINEWKEKGIIDHPRNNDNKPKIKG